PGPHARGPRLRERRRPRRQRGAAPRLDQPDRVGAAQRAARAGGPALPRAAPLPAKPALPQPRTRPPAAPCRAAGRCAVPPDAARGLPRSAPEALAQGRPGRLTPLGGSAQLAAREGPPQQGPAEEQRVAPLAPPPPDRR